MRVLFCNVISRIKRLRPGRYFYVAVVAVGFFLVAAASRDLYTMQREDSSAHSEYEALRELYYTTPAPSRPATVSQKDPLAAEQAEPLYAAQLSMYPDPNAISAQEQPDPLESLLEMNPDFVGWVAINGVIDYPVVQGDDNDFYLGVTFSGNSNPAGAVFMDYRNTRGFDSPICILYGHNMRDGSMFAGLNRYLDPAFMAAHPDIAIMTPEGKSQLYRIYAAERTNAWDATYDLDYADGATDATFDNAPGGANQLLMLSTCTNNEDRGERLLVYASLVPR